MQNSRIEWTDHTFNPWIGCQKVSPGCQHCYAETYCNRFGVEWGPQGERKRTSPAYWRKPLTWNRQRWMECRRCGWRGDEKKLLAKNHCSMCYGNGTLAPTRQRVFCASLADVFEERPELVEWRAELFRLIRETPNLDWLLLTKRPEKINQMLFGWTTGTAPIMKQGVNVLPNLWLGTSVENQERANKRIPSLLTAWGASVRFLSCEPLLGLVDLTAIPILDGKSTINALTGLEPIDPETGLPRGGAPSISWVIVGGESGPHARPMHPDWARSLRDQCAASDVPFFFKQWGEHLPRGQWNVHGIESLMYAAGREAFGGTPPPRSLQWDEQMWAYNVGKHAASRYLDERIHNAHPQWQTRQVGCISIWGRLFLDLRKLFTRPL